MNRNHMLHGPPGLGSSNMSFGQYILNQLRNLPIRVVQRDARTGQALTNRDILEQSVKLAKVLEERQVKVGSTLAIFSENSLNWFVAACATMFTGASVVPLNPAYTEGELRHCLNISKPQIIFVSHRTEYLMNRIAETLPWTVSLIQLNNESTLKDVESLQNIIEPLKEHYQDLYQYQAAKIPRPAEQEIVILSSSGTTGLPKGVMLSHRNLFAIKHALEVLKYAELKENAVFLITLPFFHGYGFATMLFILSIGATAIIMDSFEPELFCQSIQKYRVNMIPLAPPLMVFLAKHPIVLKYDLSSLQEIICGAAPLPINVFHAVQERLGGKISFRIGYGMTELSVLVSLTPRGPVKADSVGCLTPGTFCKIIEPTTSKSLEAYQTGELCFKGDHVMLGYRGNPEETAATIDHDGWLHTGDLGYFDHDNHLFIVGRLKELIKYKGFQIAPVEIENILLSHPQVQDAGVIGKKCEESGEIPMAFVVRKPGTTVTPQELREFVDERVSPQKRLRGGVKIVNSIPKNPGGKILRKELVQWVSKL